MRLFPLVIFLLLPGCAGVYYRIEALLLYDVSEETKLIAGAVLSLLNVVYLVSNKTPKFLHTVHIVPLLLGLQYVLVQDPGGHGAVGAAFYILIGIFGFSALALLLGFLLFKNRGKKHQGILVLNIIFSLWMAVPLLMQFGGNL